MNISLAGTDGGVSVVLLWGETGVHRENPPGDHTPSHLSTPEIETGKHWWEAKALTSRPEGHLQAIHIFSVYHSLEMPNFVGIGFAGQGVLLYSNIYYVVIIAWAIYYMHESFTSELPWTTCDKPWNTDRLVSINSTDNETKYPANNRSKYIY